MLRFSEVVIYHVRINCRNLYFRAEIGEFAVLSYRGAIWRVALNQLRYRYPYCYVNVLPPAECNCNTDVYYSIEVIVLMFSIFRQ